MPFECVTILPETLKILEPLASFDPRTIFNSRIADADGGKRLVAKCLADKFGSEGGSALILDGSSTFYAALAIALSSVRFRHPFHLLTNNLALTTELDARPGNPHMLTIELLGGQMDYTLNATFSTRTALTSELLASVQMVIASVRELFWLEGPTSPDLKSLTLKREALLLPVPIIIPITWEKLSSAFPAPATTVFADRKAWQDILKNRNREIWIISNKPPGCDDNTQEKGMLLTSGGMDRVTKKDAWGEADPLERYWWQAFTFSQYEHVTFVEVAFPDSYE